MTSSSPPTAPATKTQSDDDAITFTEMIERALADAPATSFELVGRLEELWPGFLGRRTGLVHPALLELRRSGRVEARWCDLGYGRRRVHRLRATDAPWPEESVAPPREFVEADPRLRDVADRSTRSLRFAARLCEEAYHDVLGHLLDDVRARVADGAEPDVARRRAIRHLGDPWKIRTDLCRTARGRRTVLFPRSLRESLLGLVIYDLRILLVIVATILFVRVQVVTAYHIPTKSMEPTLHGDERDGDRILVNKLASRPTRGQIWVFDGWKHDRKNYVKRCMGLPGETISIFEGDLYVDDRLLRKDGDLLEALLFPVYRLEDEVEQARSDAAADGEDDWLPYLDERLQGLWIFDDPSRWRFQGHGGATVTVPADADGPARMRYAHQLVDGLYDPRTEDPDYGRLDFGDYDVPDLRATTEVVRNDEAAHVSLRLLRGGLRFDVELGGELPGCRLLVDGEVVADLPEQTFPVGEARRVRFSQVDRVLRVEVDGELVARHELPAPEFPKYRAPRGLFSVLVHAGSASLAVHELERDVYYTPDYDDHDEERLGPDEFLMLGDNSNNSTDSRSRGPVHRSRLVGRPMLVVWPPNRLFHLPE